MSLRDTFLGVPPRETAGSRSSDRFAYQRDWALCQLLKLHSSASDYLIVFDLHDDVLVFDAEANPTLISFYQVKTKAAKHWTRSDLLRAQEGKEGPKLSILGKLYSNKRSFPDHTRALTFVSNAPISLDLADGTKSLLRQQFRCVELSSDDRAAVSSRLTEECGECSAADIDALLAFEVSDLSLADHQTHAQGKLGEFLDALQPSSHRTVKVSVVYKTLSDEITRRNNHTLERNASFGDMPTRKGFGRTGFHTLLAEAGLFENLIDTWNSFENRLNSEQMPYRRVQSLKRRWGIIEAQRLNTENRALKKLMRRVGDVLETLAGNEPDRLTDLLDVVVAKTREVEPTLAFDDDDIRVVAMMRSHGAGELPSADPGTSEASQ